ncbi:hypothetical protein BDZ85DRAFT_254041 [Elsinoe ampelina]|uniref:Uncharacterized protein n=1 Tax=Elsinoe ampelina TaxID=302913 RepID=A0A6A6GPH5_9PEZI|nr:hypothetical protein BDZ85DRAFT_254041 [Elsinoe ampelina]
MTDNKRPADLQQHFKRYQKAKEQYYESVGLDWKDAKPRNSKKNPSFTAEMPVQPKEEETHGNLTDQVAKESSDSTASSAGLHQGKNADKATIQDHQANPGPAISDKLPEAASKDELKARAEELNKK